MEDALALKIHVQPERLIAGVRTVLQLRFENPSPEPWYHLRGRLLIQENALLIGDRGFQVTEIPPQGQALVFRLVKPLHPGEIGVQLTRLTARVRGTVKRLPDRTFSLRAQPSQHWPMGALHALREPSVLQQGTWSPLRVMVFNSGDTPVSLRGPCLESKGLEIPDPCRDAQKITLHPEQLWQGTWRCRPLESGEIPFQARFPVQDAEGTWHEIGFRFTVRVESFPERLPVSQVTQISVGDVVQVRSGQGLLETLTRLAAHTNGQVQMGDLILLSGGHL